MSEAPLAPQVPLDSLDALDLKDLPDQLERKVDRARKDLKDQLEETVFRDLWVCLDQEDLQGLPERMETRESWENQARKEAKETKENMVHQVPPVLRVPLGLQVQLAQMVSPVPGVSRVCSARRETKGPEGSPDLPAPSGCRACRVHLARKEKLEMLVKWVHPVLLVPGVPQGPREPTGLRDLRAASETLVL